MQRLIQLFTLYDALGATLAMHGTMMQSEMSMQSVGKVRCCYKGWKLTHQATHYMLLWAIYIASMLSHVCVYPALVPAMFHEERLMPDRVCAESAHPHDLLCHITANCSLHQ